ncbi:tyrosine-protein phosphatase [Serratia quinivorans]|uniref:tyrosine-protein phosphatase n=1 Tax=Serratia quinivorans TaxID=137545 RepID=UPI00217B1929|nr:tyrosine-protein phosphatase [Serratia quinivorans]CAI0941841.1 Protein tyrosine/serine phosphatase [Serratia quinivorans]CAI1741360.1 Protein tyrosine/serine phosphatase [Serratia quinivorans]
MINCRRVKCGNVSFFRTSLSYSSGKAFPTTLDVLVDFRGRTAAEALFPFAKNIVHMPMDTVGESYRRSLNPTIGELVEFYIEIVDKHRVEFSKLFGIVASTPVVGFGCYFGKDRTGIASYLLARKFNATIDNIILDYTRSEYELRKNIDLFSAHWLKRNISKENYMRRLICPTQAIQSLDHYLAQRYGGIDYYLDKQLIV